MRRLPANKDASVECGLLLLPFNNCRVGQACNSGPLSGVHRFALANPTTIGPKVSIFQELRQGSFLSWCGKWPLLRSLSGFFLKLQAVSVFGQAATHQGSREFNDDKFLQTTIDACQVLPLPTMIAGALNCDPTHLPSFDYLQSQGYSDLKSSSQRQYGHSMPATCKDATWPDQALLCPALMQDCRLLRVWIIGTSMLTDSLFGHWFAAINSSASLGFAKAMD